jgi:hypothetical protein
VSGVLRTGFSRNDSHGYPISPPGEWQYTAAARGVSRPLLPRIPEPANSLACSRFAASRQPRYTELCHEITKFKRDRVRRLRTAPEFGVVESANGGDLGSAQGSCESQEAQGVLRGGEYRAHRSLAITGADPDHSVGEVRWITFGLSTRRRLLAVSHTEEDEIIRIIKRTGGDTPRT